MYADHQEWAKGKPQYFDQKNHNQAMLSTAASCARKFWQLKSRAKFSKKCRVTVDYNSGGFEAVFMASIGPTQPGTPIPASNALTPFQVMLTPMHTMINAESRTTTIMPVCPIHPPTRWA